MLQNDPLNVNCHQALLGVVRTSQKPLRRAPPETAMGHSLRGISELGTSKPQIAISTSVGKCTAHARQSQLCFVRRRQVCGCALAWRAGGRAHNSLGFPEKTWLWFVVLVKLLLYLYMQRSSFLLRLAWLYARSLVSTFSDCPFLTVSNSTHRNSEEFYRIVSFVFRKSPRHTCHFFSHCTRSI